MPRFSFQCGSTRHAGLLPSLLISTHVPPPSALHFPSGLSWPAPVILGLLGPSSHASVVQLCPGMAEIFFFSLYPPQAGPKVIYPYIAPLGTVLRPRSFHKHIHVGELPDLCPCCHWSPSSHPLCPQPAPKPISRGGRLWPRPCVVPAGSTGSSHPPPSATASGGTGSPCTAHVASGSQPVPSICSVCGDRGCATSAPPAAHFSSGQPWVKAGSWQSLPVEV